MSADLGGSLGDIVMGTMEGFTPAKYGLMESKNSGRLQRSIALQVEPLTARTRTKRQMPRILSCSDNQ